MRFVRAKRAPPVNGSGVAGSAPPAVLRGALGRAAVGGAPVAGDAQRAGVAPEEAALAGAGASATRTDVPIAIGRVRYMPGFLRRVRELARRMVGR